MRKPWLAFIIVILLFTGLAGAVILSNTLNYSGFLQSNPLELSYSNGDPNPVTLLSGQTEVFNLTVANTDNGAVNFVVSITFTPSFVVETVTGDLTRISLTGGVYVPTIETLTWTDVGGVWYAESGSYTLAAFAADWYELGLAVTFSGSGTYALDIVANI